MKLLEIKISYWHTNPNLGNANEAMRSGKEAHPSRVLFICRSKRLKDYYAPMT
jgi:hypothetical protein